MLPGPAPVLVTWLPGPPSESGRMDALLPDAEVKHLNATSFIPEEVWNTMTGAQRRMVHQKRQSGSAAEGEEEAEGAHESVSFVKADLDVAILAVVEDRTEDWEALLEQSGLEGFDFEEFEADLAGLAHDSLEENRAFCNLIV